MLLDRIDIDNHGPLKRVELGPFSESLNVVCAPQGSGKTAIARFVRDSLIRREYPLGMMSSSSGRVVWADRNGKIHCRREHDGTATGRRTIEFESRGEAAHRFDWLHGSWINGIADSTDASRALESIRIPESIVDGIVTDTAVTSISRVIQACLASGLGDPSLFASLPVHRSHVSGLSPSASRESDQSRRALRDELARIESELAMLEQSGAAVPTAVELTPATHDIHSAATHTAIRRDELHRRLAFLRSRQTRRPAARRFDVDADLAQLQDQIWSLRVRQGELTRWLGHLELDRKRVGLAAPSTTLSPTSSYRADGHFATAPTMRGLDEDLRDKLIDADAQIIRWRRLLTELSELAQLVAANRVGVRDGRLTGSTTHWSDEIDLRIEAVLVQIDTMISHYASRPASASRWYRNRTVAADHAGDFTLINELRAIQNDLQNELPFGFGATHGTVAADRNSKLRRAVDRDQLRRAERWIHAAVDQLFAYRDGLVRNRRLADLVRYPSWMDASYHRQSWSAWYIHHLDQERFCRSEELNHVTADLERFLKRAETLRMTVVPDLPDSELHAEINSILTELQRLEIPSVVERPRVTWLKSRRQHLVKMLGTPHPIHCSGIPLADEASQWLVRLSGGRLRRLDWDPSAFTTESKQVALTSQSGFAQIDGRDEALCPAIDRALATLALRLAAADLLARTGRSIPLVIEAHRDLLRPTMSFRHAEESFESGMSACELGHLNLAVIEALDDFAKSGRQVIVLSSDGAFADHVGRRGGQVFTIRGERVSHEHRPLWQPHFASESYAGPHQGAHLQPLGNDPLPQTDARVDQYYDQYFDNLPVGATLADINRNLDAVWQEAYGVSRYHTGPSDNAAPAAEFSRPPQRPPRSVASVGHATASGARTWHDGYYFTDAFTTAPVATEPAAPPRSNEFSAGQTMAKSSQSKGAESNLRPQSPFFLSVDSPIDQAPSIDAVAAARLRGLNVSHINHLMNQDPNRLSDSLGLAGVTAATVRRWQAECRLVCHVPQLRGFDARVLVGCGIADAAQLSSTDPNDLLDRVEAFLATERGQRILLSGTSYELSRITSWIAAGNVETDSHRVDRRDNQTVDGRVIRQVRSERSFDPNVGQRRREQGRNEYEFVDDHGVVVRASSGRSRTQRSADKNGLASQRRRKTTGQRYEASADGSRSRKPAANRVRGRRKERDVQGAATENDLASADRSNAARRQKHTSRSVETELRFYLDRESPIVDAPSIGDRMAAKLDTVGIKSVDDLLNTDASDLADRLDHRRIDAEVISAWQNQAILVCRIPMLRGHDAQLLVAADVTTPEEVADYDPDELFELIDPIARSNEGKRILRGGQLPDLEEITQWIDFATRNRELMAA